MSRVVVVTVSESFPLNGSEETLRCFSSHEKAVRWIEGRIDENAQTFGLDRATAVAGGFVQIAHDRAIQCVAHELEVE